MNGGRRYIYISIGVVLTLVLVGLFFSVLRTIKAGNDGLGAVLGVIGGGIMVIFTTVLNRIFEASRKKEERENEASRREEEDKQTVRRDAQHLAQEFVKSDKNYDSMCAAFKVVFPKIYGTLKEAYKGESNKPNQESDQKE